MLIWLWGLHNFWHQAFSLKVGRQAVSQSPAWFQEPVAILCTTCDDFDPHACASLLAQDHQHCRLIICDDSVRQTSRDRIDEWARSLGPAVTVVRRQDRRGFKAGNLNHAIESVVTEKLFLICDADEVIPPQFVSTAIKEFGRNDVSFVQCAHISKHSGETWFENSLGPAVDVFYGYTLPSRTRFGFVACFGHGAMIRRDTWQATGGFPEVLTEDLAFSMIALTLGFRGLFVEEPIGMESFPKTYLALVSKYRRIVSGTIESWRRFGWSLLSSRHASFVEKFDATLTFSTCYLPLITLASVLGTLVFSHFAAESGYARLQRWLLALYLVGPLTPVIPLIRNLFKSPVRYGKFAIVGAVTYASLLPTLAYVAICQTLFRDRVDFAPTGVVERLSDGPRTHYGTLTAGFAVLILATVLPSPAFGPSVVFGSMLVIGPFLSLADRPSVIGRLVRWSTVLPYVWLVWGLVWAGW
jgi:GT2 family glycosyltransferase